MLSEGRRTQLSKLMSLALRHEPGKFGLCLDDEGFVPLAQLLTAFRQSQSWSDITEGQIREVVTTSDKQRFEIAGENIRARYGHSVPQRVTYPEIEPPEILYHGTAPRSLPSIRRDGIQSMKRQYVHLSSEREQARIVGRRHCPGPVILLVRAQDAWRAGTKFYQPEGRLYLADGVPAKFVTEDNTENP